MDIVMSKLSHLIPLFKNLAESPSPRHSGCQTDSKSGLDDIPAQCSPPDVRWGLCGLWSEAMWERVMQLLLGSLGMLALETRPPAVRESKQLPGALLYGVPAHSLLRSQLLACTSLQVQERVCSPRIMTPILTQLRPRLRGTHTHHSCCRLMNSDHRIGEHNKMFVVFAAKFGVICYTVVVTAA